MVIGKMNNKTQSFTKEYHLIIILLGIAVLLVGLVSIAINASFGNRTLAAEGTVLDVV